MAGNQAYVDARTRKWVGRHGADLEVDQRRTSRRLIRLSVLIFSSRSEVSVIVHNSITLKRIPFSPCLCLRTCKHYCYAEWRVSGEIFPLVTPRTLPSALPHPLPRKSVSKNTATSCVIFSLMCFRRLGLIEFANHVLFGQFPFFLSA